MRKWWAPLLKHVLEAKGGSLPVLALASGIRGSPHYRRAARPGVQGHREFDSYIYIRYFDAEGDVLQCSLISRDPLNLNQSETGFLFRPEDAGYSAAAQVEQLVSTWLKQPGRFSLASAPGSRKRPGDRFDSLSDAIRKVA